MKQALSMRKYSCEHCFYAFEKECDLKRHYRMRHPNEKTNVSKILARCSLQKSNLTQHLPSHTQKELPSFELRGKSISDKNNWNHTIQPYSCEEDSNLCSLKEDLEKLNITDKKEKPHSCKAYGKAFSMRHDLISHRFTFNHFSTHENVRKYSCEHCFYAFEKEYNLKRHYRMRHPNEKPNVLKCLENASRRYSNLTQHLPSRTKEELHSCGLCGKSFLKINNLKIHYLLHIKQKSQSSEESANVSLVTNDSEQPCITHEKVEYLCEPCGYTYTTVGNLMRHNLRKHYIPLTRGSRIKL